MWSCGRPLIAKRRSYWVETVRCGRCLVGGKEESGVKVGMCSQDYVMIGAVRAHVDDKKRS